MSLLEHLNPQQREAVEATEGPVLVLAGAGSGKTRVITYRVAHLISTGVPGGAILSVTFTNKAAEEMKERVAALLRSSSHAADPWVSTFHSLCARLLRREAPRVGLRRDFAIYDDDDQLAVVKATLRQLGQDEKSSSPRDILGMISRAKNDGQTPEEFAASAQSPQWKTAAKVYALYEAQLRKAGAVDFDDLLLRTRDVLRHHREALDYWGGRFRYIQVDEYQDTNRIQYELVRLLAKPHGNLCVVGDEDQSIYSWRGADVGNILRFERDFPGARIFRIEENYRSTQSILDAAGAVVANNRNRLGKTLRATRGAGANLRFFEARTAMDEAEFVAQEIYRLQARGDLDQRIGVLYRTNFQSRAFEEAFRRLGIRYKVVGGFSFYQRAEVKDTVAYVRLAINPADDVALLRVLNMPPRGIGQGTVDRLRNMSEQSGGSLWEALGALAGATAGTRASALRGFRELIEELQRQVGSLGPAEFLHLVLDRSGYLAHLEQQDLEKDSSRAENVRELVNAVAEGEQQGETLADFLDRTALVSDADDYDASAPVTLMTLHSAKGLEFHHVFLAGMDEGLFPHSRSANSPDELEEERRLCYVGMTRARDTLSLTRANFRRTFGSELNESAQPSRFLSEIPTDLIDVLAGSLSEAAGDGRRYVSDPEFDDYSGRRGYAGRGSYGGQRWGGQGRSGSRTSAGASSSASAAPARARTNPLIGMRVRHPKYGVGTVLSVEGDDEDRRLTISFPDYGTKKLVERYANLVRE
jgi:DNA helicase-2/ATP-dependent DNA helicase PcrA